MILLVLSVLLSVPPGYADDSLCAGCHREIAETYQHVGMSRSFSKARASNAIENLDAPPYFHEKSKQYFEMRKRGDGLVFRRWQLSAEGKQIHVFEQIVDWILGSGHTSRTYLYATPGGELYQLPIAWYSQTKQWRMAPGYDRADHDGVTRRVRHECMFCHNAYPNVAKSRESYWRAQTFPRELPEGLGCQRCHGPGAKHAAIALTGDMEKTRKSIVNPARLDPPRRMDVCYECHMQPAVELFGIRRFGRDVYSFRPGESLSDYTLHIDVTEPDLPRAERFEINHHPYRLEQSPCFKQSGGKLSCLTCHNPHRKVPAEQRAAHYRAACMSCHEKAHHPSPLAPLPAERGEGEGVRGDCIACHMPRRRTQDVVHVVMTDHFIRRKPGGPELLAPLAERQPDPRTVDFLDPARAPSGALGEMYRLLPLLRAHGGANASQLQRLEKLIAEVKPEEVEPYLDLASGQLRHRRFEDLEKTANTILARVPGHPLALEWLGIARAGRTGNRDEAIRLLEEALKREPRPETEFNLGLFLFGAGRTAEAVTHYERALAARPNFAAAWLRLAEAQRAMGETGKAAESLRRAQAIQATSP